jgi:hypothetical protein
VQRDFAPHEKKGLVKEDRPHKQNGCDNQDSFKRAGAAALMVCHCEIAQLFPGILKLSQIPTKM